MLQWSKHRFARLFAALVAVAAVAGASPAASLASNIGGGAP